MENKDFEFNPGAILLDRIETDPRDIVLGDVLGEPTDDDLSSLPDVVDLIKYIPYTLYQDCVPSCTAHAKAHENMIRQSIDLNNNGSEFDVEKFRENLGHKNKCSGEVGDTLENNLKEEYKNGFPGKSPDGTETKFMSKRYGYIQYKQDGKDVERLKYRLSQGLVPYMACIGNSHVWKQMSEGEIKIAINSGQATGGHAFICAKIDKEFVYFINSWKANNNGLSIFKMTHQMLKNAVNKGMFYRRYWIVYDVDDGDCLFPDYDPMPDNADNEEYNAVKWAKDTGLIKGVKHSDGKYYLEPHRPVTRLELLIILYRQRNKQ